MAKSQKKCLQHIGRDLALMEVSQAFIFGKSQAGSLRFRGFRIVIVFYKFGAFISFALFMSAERKSEKSKE